MSSIYSKTESALRFLRYALDIGAVRSGEFQLKSGCTSSYFFDMGKFSSGSSLSFLAEMYTECIVENLGVHSFRRSTQCLYLDVVLGPAYKGIPLATLVATEYLERYHQDICVCFTRKEQKDHGEEGKIIGEIRKGDKVIIVDDVITDGATKMEAVNLIKSFGATVIAVVVAFDRQESGDDPKSTAAVSFTKKTGIRVFSISDAQDLEYLLRLEKQNK